MAVTTQAEPGTFGSAPHGGELIDRYAQGAEAEKLAQEAKNFFTIDLTPRELSDVEMIAMGAYSPLTGFMTQPDYDSVVETMHLAGGLPWTMPITLSLSPEEAKQVKAGDRVALAYEGRPLAVMDVEDRFERDRGNEAEKVYGTREEAHAGVANLMQETDTVIGGPISVFAPLPEMPFSEYRFTPAQTRQIFADRGWKTIVGFQTRNPVHRAHEYIQKTALETVDGLLLHPLVGQTKSDDVPADVRMRSYRVLLDNYYPEERVQLAVNPAAMRYAGPREAIFHALIRKNFGCTHFIVGRDHAGVTGPNGSYYGPYDSQRIFSRFEPEELGIQPLFFENSFYCKVCGNYGTEKTCPHGPEDRLTLSGTQVRSMLRNGQLPPPEFSRPEVAQVLIEGMRDQG